MRRILFDREEEEKCESIWGRGGDDDGIAVVVMAVMAAVVERE